MKRFTIALFMVLFCVSWAMAQRNVSGVVTDETGEPLIGANVQLKGSTVGTITDVDGSYSLRVPADGGNTLIISYTGF